jgi:diguanylate cyclase (GGDEF)-like protein
LAVDNLYINRPITKSDVASLLNYATQVGLAFQSLETHEKILKQSLTDPLTGLYNRRFFEQELDHEIKRCQRYGRAFTLLMADIDYFKKINDTYGHDAGDEILKQVGYLIKANLRGLDTVARVGGEEFAVILPETPPNSISVITRRLMKAMRGCEPSSRPMAGDRYKITFSLGVATYRRGPASPKQMFKLVDNSLYEAKRRGRNQVGSFRIFSKKAGSVSSAQV